MTGDGALKFFIAVETLVINRGLLREKKKSIPLWVLFLKGKRILRMKLWKSPKCTGKE